MLTKWKKRVNIKTQNWKRRNRDGLTMTSGGKLSKQRNSSGKNNVVHKQGS